MLRLFDKDKSYPLTVQGTVFHFRSLSAGERIKLLTALETVDTKKEGWWDAMMDCIAPFISGIDTELKIKCEDGTLRDATIKEILVAIEDIPVGIKLRDTILAHSSLGEAESKNSDSSLGQTTPVSTGNAEKHAVPDGDSVSTT